MQWLKIRIKSINIIDLKHGFPYNGLIIMLGKQFDYLQCIT